MKAVIFCAAIQATVELDPDAPPWSVRRPCNDGTCQRFGCAGNRNRPDRRAAWEHACAAQQVKDYHSEPGR